MTARLRVPALAALLALAGCAFLPRAPQPSTDEGEWGKQRDLATRRAYIYDGLTHRATVTAIHLSLPVREARTRRLGEWYGWTPVELERRLALERKAAAESEEFVVSFYTAEPRFNDLDAPRSDWRLALKVDGADLLPRKVTADERNAANPVLYPNSGQFDVVYQVTMPMPTAGPVADRKFTFEIAGPLGRLVMDYGVPPGTITPQEPVPRP